MFGSLLGTLAKFRQEESSQKEKVGLKKKSYLRILFLGGSSSINCVS